MLRLPYSCISSVSLKKLGFAFLLSAQLVACGGGGGGGGESSDTGQGGNSGGGNSGGGNSGGENSGGENSGGENSGGENSGGENSGGENSGGENSGGGNSDVVQPNDQFDAPKACNFNKTRTTRRNDLGTGVFDSGITDAEGRHLRYRYKLPDDYNPDQEYAVSLYFHGNTSSTQEEALGRSSLRTVDNPVQGQMIKVVLASPDVRSDGARQWDYVKDAELVDILLHNDFSCQINIDPEKVFLHGASQGGCFLNSYLGDYGNNLQGGGAFVECGCSDRLNYDWIPTQQFKENFRVFVASTQDDFLHDTAVRASRYYRNRAQLDLFAANTEEPGQHCRSSADTRSRAWRFITNSLTDADKRQADVQPYPQSIRWRALSQLPAATSGMYVSAFGVSSDSEMLVALYDSANERSEIYKTGANNMRWTRQGRVADEVSTINKKDNGQWYLSTRGREFINPERTRFRYIDRAHYGPSINNLRALNNQSPEFWSGSDELVYREHGGRIEQLNTSDGSPAENWIATDYSGIFKETNLLSFSAGSDHEAGLIINARNRVAGERSFTLHSENTFGDIEQLNLPRNFNDAQLRGLEGQRIGDSIILSGSQGTNEYHVYYSANNGRNWTTINLPQGIRSNSRASVVLLPDQGLLAVSGRQMYYTKNRRNWNDWESFIFNQRYLVTADGRLLAMAGRNLYQATFTD